RTRMKSLLFSCLLMAACLVLAFLGDHPLVPFITAFLGLLAGLIFDNLGRIYRSDEMALESMGKPRLSASAGDYLSLRRMAQRLLSRASRTAIASAEVSHHADRLDKRLAEQESIVREAVASMGAIT